MVLEKITMRNTLAYILVILTLAACEKEKEPETIYPLRYFPVYPGSHWTYLVNDTDTLVSSTSPEYIEMTFISPGGETDPMLVPYLDNEPIFGYSRLCQSTYFGDYYKYYSFFSEQPGDLLTQCYDDDPHFSWRAEKLLVTAKSINTNLENIISLSGYQQSNPNVNLLEYVQNTGLTSYITVDTTTGDTVFKKVLIEHYINH
jgi:hypothetical protein